MKKKPYFAPTAEVWSLSEGKANIAPTVQILRTGEFSHPDYGHFTITKEYLLSLVTNFKNKIRKIDLAVDYKHANDDVAAGWFQDLMLSEDGEKLLAKVDWTPNGEKVLSDKEFRYLSAEFTDEYVDDEGKSYGPTLLGAGLTNRPFVKGMAPVVQLSEKPKTKEETTMTEAEKKEFEELKAANKKLQDEKDAEAKKLSEATSKLKAQEEKDAEAAKEKKLSEKKAQFDEKLKAGLVCEAQRNAFMSGDMDKFLSLAQPVKTKTLSETEANGGAAGEGDKDKEGEDAEKQIIALAEKIEKEQKLDRGRAMSKVLADPANKALREKYENKFKV